MGEPFRLMQIAEPSPWLDNRGAVEQHRTMRCQE